MTNINETVAGLELALASASSMIERLTLERDIARDERAALWDELAESHANDRTAMGYLSAIRDALGFDGDYPALVEHCQEIAPQPPAVSAEPVAYRHLHEDGWEYYDAPTGDDCDGCQALYIAPPIADAKDAEIARLRRLIDEHNAACVCHKDQCGYAGYNRKCPTCPEQWRIDDAVAKG